MTRKMLVYLFFLVSLLTWVLYNYHRSQGPDQDRIEYCNELVSGMPENTAEEINRSILRFNECLQQ